MARPMKTFGILLPCLLSFTLVSPVQAQAPPCKKKSGEEIPLRTSQITVPLDGTGIRDWSFVNPRSPYPLVRALNRRDQDDLDDDCFINHLPEVTVNFENQTSDRSFEIKFPFEITSLKSARQSVREAWEGITRRCLEVEVLSRLPESEFELQAASLDPAKRKELEIRLEDLKALKRRESLALEIRRRSDKAASSPELDEYNREIDVVEKQLAGSAPDPLAVVETMDANKAREYLQQETLKADLERMGAARDESGQLNLDPLVRACRLWRMTPPPSSPPTVKSKCQAAVDRFAPKGPGATNSVNTIGDLKSISQELQDCLDKAEEAAKADKEGLAKILADFLEQREVVRNYKILAAAPNLQQDVSKSLDELCKSKAGDPEKLLCDYTFTVNQAQTAMLKGDVLSFLNPGRVVFNVLFAGEAEPPVHNQGYFKTRKAFKESDNRTEWGFGASLGGNLSPKTTRLLHATNDQVFSSRRFSEEQPYTGDRLDGFTGAGSLSLKQFLGDRAQGNATVTFKSGNLGEKSDGSASVSSYTVTVFGDNFRQLRLGKYGLFTTRESISGSLEGESFEMIFRSLSLGYFVRKNRSETVTVNDDKVNVRTITFPERAVTFSLQNLPFRQNNVLRTWTLSGAYGDEHGNVLSKLPDPDKGGLLKPDNFQAPFRYATLGTDLTFGISGATAGGVSGAFSLYQNRRWLISGAKNDLPERIRKGKGTVGLFNLRLSAGTSTGQAPPQTIEARIGYGTGDDPKTPDRDEGYLGEGGSYTPDLLFLSKFAGNIGSLDERKRPEVAAGLSNKTYFGVSYVNTRTAFLLEALAAALGVREKTISRSTTVSLHHYRFNEPVFGEREAGNEVDVKFEVQVPKGITTSLSVGRFFSGPALDKVFVELPWTASAQVKISL